MSKSFVKNAGVLAISVIIAKVLGAVYRIPLTAIIGAEGMGLYQFVYPVFALILTLSSGAVPNAIGITVSEKLALGDKNGAKKSFSTALLLCLAIGTGGTVLLAALAYPVSLAQSEDAIYGYIAIAPAVLIVTLISAFRGWFMGNGNLVPNSVSQITEGAVKLGVGLGLTAFLIRFGIKYAVVGALLGVVASEFVTLIIMTICYFVKHKKFERIKLKEEKGTIKRLACLAVPLVACGTILPVSQFIDSVLVTNLLKWGGKAGPIAQYGLWSGVVTPLINLPVMVCISLGIAVTPQMVEGKQKRDIDFILEKAATANKLTYLMGVPFVFFYLFMAGGIIKLLFPSLSEEQTKTAVMLLMIGAPSVIGLSVFQIYSAMLQGLGRAKAPVIIMGTCMAVKLALTVILTPVMGITGCAIAAVVGYLGSGIWITVYFANFAALDAEYAKNASLITLCGVIMGMLIFMSGKLQSSWASVAVIGIIAGTVYFLAVLTLKVFSREELKSLPLSGLLIKINDKINGE